MEVLKLIRALFLMWKIIPSDRLECQENRFDILSPQARISHLFRPKTALICCAFWTSIDTWVWQRFSFQNLCPSFFSHFEKIFDLPSAGSTI